MAKKEKLTGLLIGGRLKEAGVTFYSRGGQMVARSAKSKQPERRTRAQFDSRQRLGHSIRLWRLLNCGERAMFAGGKNAYARFRSLAMSMPTVYIPTTGPAAGGTLLLPGMPVSEGVLPAVKQRLGEVEGRPALLTDLKKVPSGSTLRLYTLRQAVEDGYPVVRISISHPTEADFVHTPGGLALVGDAFADDMTGWALVVVSDDRCSTQTAVTRCRYYEQFTTEEAFAYAAASYGGLTE